MITTDKNNLDKVIHAVQKCLDDKLEIKPSLSLIDDLGFDSLRMATLAACLEEIFNQHIFLHDWIGSVEYTSMLSIDSLARFVDNAVNA